MSRLVWLSVLLPLGAVAGCNRARSQSTAPAPPEVVVAEPVRREITEFEEFTGRTEAVDTVDIRARVSGYLDKVHFKEGEEVREGDLLFEIDPRPYQAEFARTEANLIQVEAHLRRLDADFSRARHLLPKRAISQEEFDKMGGDRAEAEAAVGVAKASVDVAKLNLKFTKVYSPVAGRISRHLIDRGNLVKADDTLLTTIVSLDPMYAYFDIDERTLLKLRRLGGGALKPVAEKDMPLQLGLADEDDYPHVGKIDFVDNRVDPNTGTLRVRGIFSNPDRILTPGLFVRIHVPISKPHYANLVPEKALGTDQGQKFLFVVSPANEVVYRRVRTGVLAEGFRVVEDGVRPGERFIVSGLQRVRPGNKVTPKKEKEPELAAGGKEERAAD
jgi:RND family efflux transporter MFP subunit